MASVAFGRAMRGFAVVLLTAAAPSQTGFALFGREHLPLDSTGAESVVVADLNGDGSPDLILSDVDSLLYRKDGHARFALAAAGELALLVLAHHIAVGDIDGDGDLDLATAHGLATFGAQNRLLLNDGHAKFTDVTAQRLPVDSDRTEFVLLADLDGDRASRCCSTRARRCAGSRTTSGKRSLRGARESSPARTLARQR